MSVSIERRIYGPSSTPEEVAAIKARLTKVGKITFLWEEMPVQSPFSVQTMLEELPQRSESMSEFHLIVDLRSADPPPQDVRTALYKGLNSLTKMRKCACFTGRNFLLTAAVKFVLAAVRIPMPAYRTIEEALLAVGEA